MDIITIIVDIIIGVVLVLIGYRVIRKFGIICAFKGHTFVHLNDTIYFRINYNIITNEPHYECIYKVCNRCGCSIPTHDYDVVIKPIEM